MNKVIFLTYTLIFFPLALRADPNCSDPVGQSEELYCAQNGYEEVDKNLNEIYGLIKSKIDKNRFLLLSKSQRHWISMRDYFCDAASYENKNTTSWEYTRVYCAKKITEERIKQLELFLDDSGS